MHYAQAIHARAYDAQVVLGCNESRKLRWTVLAWGAIYTSILIVLRYLLFHDAVDHRCCGMYSILAGKLQVRSGLIRGVHFVLNAKSSDYCILLLSLSFVTV